jgi:replicative DNA helicase
MSLVEDTIIAPASPSTPYSIEAEEGVLGAVLIDSQIYYECKVNIKDKENFYIHKHRMVWQAYEELFKQKLPVDLLTVSEQLDRMGMLGDVGGPAYLMSLIAQVPSSLNAPAYAQIVRAHFVRREMINAANKIAQIAYDESIEIDKVIAESTRALSEAVSQGSTSKIRDISDGLSELYDKIEERMKSGILPGIPTGLIDLDTMLGGGAQNANLLVIAGRPGQGKTSILLQILKNSAYYKIVEKVYKKRCVIFSLEMSEEELLLGMLSQLSGIDSQSLRSGKVSDYQIAQYTPAVSPAYIRMRCEILNAEEKLDLVVVDSLNLMVSGTKFNRPDQEVDYNSYALKNLAREMDIPVWCAHQMNRGIEHRSDDARPKLSDLNEGGEKAADVVIFIWHDKDEIKKIINGSELIVEKHRGGPTGTVPVVFKSENTKFENAYVSRMNL